MQNVVAKGWGHELWIINTDEYCGKQLTVLPNKWCSLHYHKLKDETFYILEGELFLEFIEEDMLGRVIDNPSILWTISSFKKLKKGDSFRITQNMAHRFTTVLNTPCTFIEFSTHHSDEDSYRIIKGD